MKRLGMYSMVFLLLATGCSTDEVAEVEETKVEDTVEEVAEVEEVVEEVEEVEEEVDLDDVIDRESRIVLAVATLDGNFDAIGKIDYDEGNDAIRLIPTDPDFSKEILYMMTGITGTEEWDGMVESLQGLSESLTGLVDEDIYLSLVNPENEDNTILLLQDGNIIYNLSDEL